MEIESDVIFIEIVVASYINMSISSDKLVYYVEFCVLKKLMSVGGNSTKRKYNRNMRITNRSFIERNRISKWMGG